MATLYEITGDVLRLQEMLENGDFDEETINNTLEDVMTEFEDKADAYGKVIRNMETNLDGIKAEISRLTEKKKAAENGITRIKERLKGAMEATGTEKIQGELFKFYMKNNAKSLPEDIPNDAIPEKYWKQVDPVIDRRGLLDAVKSGEVTGIELRQTRSLIMK